MFNRANCANTSLSTWLVAIGGVGLSKTFVPRSGVPAPHAAAAKTTAEANNILTMLAPARSEARDGMKYQFDANRGQGNRSQANWRTP
jgi:hypothetical protein